MKDNLEGLRLNSELIEKYLKIIQNTDKIVLEINSENKLERYIIYSLCRLFGYKYEKIIHNSKLMIGCDKFSDFKDSCGCINAPLWFRDHYDPKYPSRLDYDAIIIYKYIWNSHITGVKIFRN